MAGEDSRRVEGFYERYARGITFCFALLTPFCVWGVLGARPRTRTT